jgi:hypothetical protein
VKSIGSILTTSLSVLARLYVSPSGPGMRSVESGLIVLITRSWRDLAGNELIGLDFDNLDTYSSLAFFAVDEVVVYVTFFVGAYVRKFVVAAIELRFAYKTS